MRAHENRVFQAGRAFYLGSASDLHWCGFTVFSRLPGRPIYRQLMHTILFLLIYLCTLGELCVVFFLYVFDGEVAKGGGGSGGVEAPTMRMQSRRFQN